MSRTRQPRETPCCPYKPTDFAKVGNRNKEAKAQIPRSSYELLAEGGDPKKKGTRAIAIEQSSRLGRGKAAATWACGDQRQSLRREFNSQEMCAAKLITKYDTNQ